MNMNMKRIVITIFCILGVFLTQSQTKLKNDFTPLDQQITRWINRNYYPGASVVIAKDDSVVFEKYYGNYSPETEVYIASAGKWLAAAVVAAVVDQTDLKWNDPVEKWLPEFKGDPKSKILLRQLLSHTSGIRNYQPSPKTDNFNTLKESVAEILPLEPVFTAGKRFEYGGLAMQVAGRMTEMASGKDFETLFQDLIASGEVQVLLPGWEPKPLPLNLVSPPERRRTAKVRAFSDHLSAALANSSTCQ